MLKKIHCKVRKNKGLFENCLIFAIARIHNPTNSPLLPPLVLNACLNFILWAVNQPDRNLTSEPFRMAGAYRTFRSFAT
jgi:hypothetical protein